MKHAPRKQRLSITATITGNALTTWETYYELMRSEHAGATAGKLTDLTLAAVLKMAAFPLAVLEIEKREQQRKNRKTRQTKTGRT